MGDVLRDMGAEGRTSPGIAASGLYVHIPFCKRRCGYCDFYVEVRPSGIFARAVDAILREAEIRAGSWTEGPIDTVFLGGGTPSLLGPELVGRLLRGLASILPIIPDCEWTMEANPESAGAPVLAAARAGGVNRVSFGVQSFDARALRELQRLHDPSGAREAVARAREAGFTNVNLDLILGLPGPRSFETWRESLEEAIALAPEHLSCYLLSLEPHVPMARRIASGGLELPGEDDTVASYEHARSRLAAAGYEQYEISNWARPGRRCLHHVNVWTGGTYLGLGPGAHGHHAGVRRANRPDLEGYLAAVEAGIDPPHESTRVGARERREERLLLGLRLREGIAWETLRTDLGEERSRRLRLRARTWTRQGLLEDDGESLRIGEKGLMVSNTLILELALALEEAG